MDQPQSQDSILQTAVRAFMPPKAITVSSSQALQTDELSQRAGACLKWPMSMFSVVLDQAWNRAGGLGGGGMIHNEEQRQDGSVKPWTVSGISWALSDREKEVYDKIFEAEGALNTGLFHGETALQVFSASGLPWDELACIWTLADPENHGALNIKEFQVAMGLIYRRLNGMSIPYHLPPELALQPVHNPTSSDHIEHPVEKPTAVPLPLPETPSAPASTSPQNPHLSSFPSPLASCTQIVPPEEADRQRELSDLEHLFKKLSDELAQLPTGADMERRRFLEEELIALAIVKIPAAKQEIKAKLNDPPMPSNVGPAGIKVRRPPPPVPSPSSLHVKSLVRSIEAGKQLRPTRTVVRRSACHLGEVVGDAGLSDHVGDGSGTARVADDVKSLVHSIKTGKVLRPTQTVIRSPPCLLGRVVDDPESLVPTNDEDLFQLVSRPPLLGQPSVVVQPQPLSQGSQIQLADTDDLSMVIKSLSFSFHLEDDEEYVLV